MVNKVKMTITRTCSYYHKDKIKIKEIQRINVITDELEDSGEYKAEVSNDKQPSRSSLVGFGRQRDRQAAPRNNCRLQLSR